MSYRWTTRRRKARNRLITLGIFVILYSPFASMMDFHATPEGISSTHPILAVVWWLLILIGFYTVANDARILIFDDEE